MTAQAFGNFDQAFNHARALLKKGEFTQALQQVNEIQKLFPGDIRIIFLKGVVERRLGNHTEARFLLKKVVKKEPELAAAHQELGHVLFALKQMNDSKQAL